MLLLHATRRDSRIHPVWNIACDFVVNWLIKEAAVLTSHVKMPSDPKPIGLCDDKFANMTSEQVYDLLDKTMIVVLWPDLVSGNADDQAKNHGSSTNAISKALNRTQEERKKRGLEPSNFERIAKAGLDAKAYWGDCLRQKMTSSGADSYNWARRNKKGIPHKIYLPNHRGFVLAKILFVFDTSGSIDDLFLGQMVAELNQLLHTNPTSSITVITCDTEIHMLGEFSAMNPLDPLQVLLPGGGGTDFRKPFIFAQENYFKQIVYLTDSEGTFPERAPECLSTVWLLPEAQQSHVPFGDVIRVPIKAA
jgi:predicted metal-dependent peptidase